MSRFRILAAIASLTTFGSLAWAQTTTPPLRLNYPPPGEALSLKDNFGYRLPPAAGAEGNFLQEYQDLYIAPRAFPKKEINSAARYREYLLLKERRALLKMPHINAGFASGPLSNGDNSNSGSGIVPFDINGRGANGLAWRSVGPTNVNGRITNIAVDPNNHDRVFAATVGGVWRSTDGARSWQNVTDDFLAQVFASVAVDPDKSEIIAGTGDPDYQSASGIGIWRSTSNGDLGTWTKVSPPALDNQVIYRLRYDPAAPHNIYAATSAGVYIGTHTATGISWTQLGGFDANASDMVVDFSVTPRLVYAGVFAPSPTYGRGLWKYNGTSWNERDSGIPLGSTAVWALAIAQTAPGTIYAKISQSGGHLLDVFKTTTGGEKSGGSNAWKALGATSLDDSCAMLSSGEFCYSWYNSIIEVDPTDANTVFAAGLSPWVSTTGGTSWTLISQGTDTSDPVGVHSDHHAFAFDPTNHNIVYAGNDGGLYKSSDMSSPWHWNDVSHGMIVTQFYHGVTSQQAATLFAGGSQDNGTEITFGNRTWYPPGGCDGSDVGVDKADTDTLYANCNGGLYELANPVPGTSGGGSHITWGLPSGLSLHAPIRTNPGVAHFTLSAATNAKKNYLATTDDNVNWTQSAEITGGNITTIAGAPTDAKTIYVGLDAPTIIRTNTGGTSWLTTSTGLPTNLRPNDIAVDFSNANRAIAVFGGSAGAGVYITTTGGASWTSIGGSGTTAIPNVPLTGVALDPTNSDIVYVSSTIGVFMGTISGTTASWVPYDEGIPDGLDVNDIAVNNATKTLSISAFGHGAFERDINPADKGGSAITVVRDDVSDTGIGASDSSGIPDPEHPIPDPSRPNFYMPNNSTAGLLYWWDSPDIRLDVPSFDPPANQIPSADSVEMETCPIEITGCPPGVIIDSNPEQGKSANVYVQVANAGLKPATKVRVIAMYADATVAVPPLPSNFWTTTFPAGSSSCGALDTSTGWHLPDTAKPCVVIPVVNPEYPETAKFAWNVSPTQAQHTCMLVIIESADDPIPTPVRSLFQSYQIVPQNHQIAQRNLHVVNSSTPGAPAGGTEGMGVPNPTDNDFPVQLIFDRTLLPHEGSLSVFLPAAGAKETRGIKEGKLAKPIDVDPETAAYAKKYGIDLSTEYQVISDEAEIAAFPVGVGRQSGVVLKYSSGPMKPDTAARFTIMEKKGTTVLGGSTYVLRSRAAEYTP